MEILCVVIFIVSEPTITVFPFSATPTKQADFYFCDLVVCNPTDPVLIKVPGASLMTDENKVVQVLISNAKNLRKKENPVHKRKPMHATVKDRWKMKSHGITQMHIRNTGKHKQESLHKHLFRSKV